MAKLSGCYFRMESDRILSGVLLLEKWVWDNALSGYDPFDGLSSPMARPLTFEIPIFRMLLEQMVKRSPINLRPFLGIKKSPSSKSMGLFASSYLYLYQFLNERKFLSKAIYCLNWLTKNRLKGYSEYCWGNAYDHQSRVFYYSKDVPTIVGTSFIANAFLDAYDLSKNEDYLRIATSSGYFIINELGLIPTDTGICFSYIPGCNIKIFNSTMLGAELLARLYHYTKISQFYEYTIPAVEYVLSKQNKDGSWFYGEGRKLKWVDNFHTGYILVSLKRIQQYLNKDIGSENLSRGLKFYLEYFIDKDGAPRYYHNKKFPIDIQSASQSIITLYELKSLNKACDSYLNRVLDWTFTNMQDKSGYFYYRIGKFFKNKTPMIYWGQANMMYALTRLLRSR